MTMANATQSLVCGNCVFYNNFDSANLARVEEVEIAGIPENDIRDTDGMFLSNANNADVKPDCEFNVWTKHDCHGTEYQNNNRTWFYFGIKPNTPGVYVKLNVVNLNRQSKMFSQGMCPVFKTVPGHPHWERIRDKPTYAMDQKGCEFTLSFTYRTPDNPKAISYLAFTYPFTYQDLQNYLTKIDNRMSSRILLHPDDIYYHRECAIKSLEGRRMDLLTISSFHNISTDREDRLSNMFIDTEDPRSFKFIGKKVVFMSARVHPGETPSSFVFNGFLNFLINRDDPIAVILRRIYVFKLIPMLNPDGVAQGHYRMDTRGVNLNRVYLEPSLEDHPTIFAARSLISYYHNHYKIVDEPVSQDSRENMDNANEVVSRSVVSNVGPTGSGTNAIKDTTKNVRLQVTLMTLDETKKCEKESRRNPPNAEQTSLEKIIEIKNERVENGELTNKKKSGSDEERNSEDSGLFLYIDLHGHASKKGIFMYGNHFDDPEDTIMCMLLPKLMSINDPNFHFTSCSFAERNMYLIDKKDGTSREGSGRVAVYKLTGLVRSYTLECNYNSGRLVNTLPQRVRDGNNKTPSHMFVPPKYTPAVFEEVGAALGPSILDLTNSNPNSRLPNSQYRSLRGVKSFLKLTCVNNHRASINRTRFKDNTVAKEAPTLEDIVSSMNCVAMKDTENPPTNDANVTVKPRIVRPTISLYTTVKRMKNSKKIRQVVNRKCLQNQRSANIDNGTVTATIRSSHRRMKIAIRKPMGQRVSKDTNIQNIGSGQSPLRSKRVKKNMTKPAIEENAMTNKTTTAIKHGPKRLKIVSPRIIKTRPEIGEFSKVSMSEEISATPSSVIRFRNKLSARGPFGRCRKPSLKADNKAKPRKTSKLKTKLGTS